MFHGNTTAPWTWLRLKFTTLQVRIEKLFDETWQSNLIIRQELREKKHLAWLQLRSSFSSDNGFLSPSWGKIVNLPYLMNSLNDLRYIQTSSKMKYNSRITRVLVVSNLPFKWCSKLVSLFSDWVLVDSQKESVGRNFVCIIATYLLCLH